MQVDRESPRPAEPPNYFAYLLRLWRDGETASWRASLEAPGHSRIVTFPDLEALFAFLNTQTGEIQPWRADRDAVG